MARPDSVIGSVWHRVMNHVHAQVVWRVARVPERQVWHRVGERVWTRVRGPGRIFWEVIYG